MAKFNVGDEVRVIDGKESEYSTGEIVTIIAYDESDNIFPFLCTDTVGDTEWMHDNEFELVKPKKSERITALETQVAELQAKVDALESAGKYPLTARFERESAEVDGILANIKRKARTPNEQRADVIKRAKAFTERAEGMGNGLSPRSEEGNVTYNQRLYLVEYHVNTEKRTVVALAKGRSGIVYERGIAKCDPDDVFNADIGKAIALARALGVEVPECYIKAVQPTEVVVGQIVEDGYGEFANGKVTEITTSPAKKLGGYRVENDGWSFVEDAIITDDTDAVYE